MILHTKMFAKQSPKIGFITFKRLRNLGLEGYVIWDCTVHGPLMCD